MNTTILTIKIDDSHSILANELKVGHIALGKTQYSEIHFHDRVFERSYFYYDREYRTIVWEGDERIIEISNEKGSGQVLIYSFLPSYPQTLIQTPKGWIKMSVYERGRIDTIPVRTGKGYHPSIYFNADSNTLTIDEKVVAEVVNRKEIVFLNTVFARYFDLQLWACNQLTYLENLANRSEK